MAKRAKSRRFAQFLDKNWPQDADPLPGGIALKRRKSANFRRFSGILPMHMPGSVANLHRSAVSSLPNKVDYVCPGLAQQWKASGPRLFIFVICG
jgi:hypothetical protein